jgi:hypothetical protein
LQICEELRPTRALGFGRLAAMNVIPAARPVRAPISVATHVYSMRMFSERLQILISKEQRRRLESEAKRRDASVASVIREAIDVQFGGVAVDDKLEALGRIAAMRGAPALPPEELRRAIAEAREEGVDRGFPGLGEG